MTSRNKAEQLPLAFGHDPATGRDDLLIAEPVDAAVAMIDAWPHWPAPSKRTWAGYGAPTRYPWPGPACRR